MDERGRSGMSPVERRQSGGRRKRSLSAGLSQGMCVKARGGGGGGGGGGGEVQPNKKPTK